MNKELKESNQKWIDKMNTLSKDLKSFYMGMTIIGICFCVFIGYIVYSNSQKPRIETLKTNYVLSRVMSASYNPSIFWYMDGLDEEWIVDTPHHNVEMTDEFRKEQEHRFDDYLEEGVFDKLLHELVIYPYYAYYHKQMKFEMMDYIEKGMDENGYMLVELKLKINKKDASITIRTKENDKIEDIEVIDKGNIEEVLMG